MMSRSWKVATQDPETFAPETETEGETESSK